jgi:hypothetical protein
VGIENQHDFQNQTTIMEKIIKAILNDKNYWNKTLSFPYFQLMAIADSRDKTKMRAVSKPQTNYVKIEPATNISDYRRQQTAAK